MPRFMALITRDVTECTSVAVDAPNPEAARAAAFAKLAGTDDAVWTLDEGSWNRIAPMSPPWIQPGTRDGRDATHGDHRGTCLDDN